MVESKLTSIRNETLQLFKQKALVKGYKTPVLIALEIKRLHEAEARKQIIESLVREGR